MIYVISDIHGQYDAFIDLLNQINFNNNDFLYCLGDYVDWGKQSMKVIKKCMELEQKGLAKCLIGNHDLMFIEQIEKDIKNGKEIGKSSISLFGDWILNGGGATYEQFGELPLKEREEIYNWLNNLDYTIAINHNNRNILLTHSYPRTQVKQTNENYIPLRNNAVWDRSLTHIDSKTAIDFINRVNDKNQIGFRINEDSEYIKYDCYIHGHTINKNYKYNQNKMENCIIINLYEIAIDCGAKVIGYDNYDYKGYRLGIYNLDTGECYYSNKINKEKEREIDKDGYEY